LLDKLAASRESLTKLADIEESEDQLLKLQKEEAVLAKKAQF